MTAFMAIVKLTCRSAMRSHVFQFLLGLLVIGILLVPNTIKGDGTAQSYIQVSLEYSLTFVAVILSLSAIWLCCQTVTADVEDQRIHLVAVKPVPMYLVWLGKLTGVLTVLGTLLVISSVIIYSFIMVQYSRQNFTPEERRKMNDEVLTGRRVFLPSLPDIPQMVRKAFEARLTETGPDGRRVIDKISPEERQKLLNELYRTTVANLAEVKLRSTKFWNYENLPEKVSGSLFLRYKAYSGMVETQQNQTREFGIWGAVCHFAVEPDLKKDGREIKPEDRSAYLQRKPEPILCGAVNEFSLPANQVVYDGKCVIGFTNLAPSGKSLFFQVADGPKLLIRQTGFFNNYFRAVVMIFLGILAVSIVASAAGSFLTMPTAVFLTAGYAAFGFFSVYLSAAKNYWGDDAMPPMEAFGYYFSQILLSWVIPLQKFGISAMVANGELIELRTIGSALLFQILMKGVPLALLGMWLYHRRELGIAALRR